MQKIQLEMDQKYVVSMKLNGVDISKGHIESEEEAMRIAKEFEAVPQCGFIEVKQYAKYTANGTSYGDWLRIYTNYRVCGK